MSVTEVDLTTEEGRRLGRSLGLPVEVVQHQSPPVVAKERVWDYHSGHYCIALECHTSRLNQLMAGVKASIRLKREDKALVSAETQGIPKATGKRRVNITVVVAQGKRRPDPDCFWKSLLDALVHCGMLVNDSPDWCEPGTVEYARGGRARMFVELWEMT